MAEARQLGPWGWFLRAFAAGFGVMCGMIAASLLACAVFYALLAVGLVAMNGVEIQTADTVPPPSFPSAEEIVPMASPTPNGGNYATPSSSPYATSDSNPYATPAVFPDETPQFPVAPSLYTQPVAEPPTQADQPPTLDAPQ